MPATVAAAAGDYLAARAVPRPRERLLALFRSARNLAYLRALFARTVPPGPLRAFALGTLEDAALAYERGEDLLYSDPLARRGDGRRAVSFAAELRRLNRAFYEDRMAFLRDKAGLLGGAPEGAGDADEPYHYRAFVADSLRPPGLEALNGPGPLWAILEDQQAPAGELARPRGDNPRGYPRREGFSATGAAAGAPPQPGVDPEDGAWDRGRPNRTAEQALAEYYGEEAVPSSSTALGAAEQATGTAYLDLYGRGPAWRENGGTRFMRYPSIPRWQDLSRGREYDRDIAETLGTGSRELDTHVRRWDMSRARAVRGEEYRRYGPRAGDTL
jgi:hypothetical protein